MVLEDDVDLLSSFGSVGDKAKSISELARNTGTMAMKRKLVFEIAPKWVVK